MAYVDPQTLHNPATSTAPPASWGDTVRDDLEWFANNRPRARVYNSAAESITTGTNTALTFNTERYDTGGCHSTVSNTSRLTVPSGGGGLYHIGGTITFAANATGDRALWIQLNGATRLVQDLRRASGTFETSINVVCDYVLAAGDYVELYVFQSSGGNLNVNASSAYTPEFWFRWVCNS